jgi:hypothetical protein
MAEDSDRIDANEPIETAPVVDAASLTLPLCLTLAALTIYFGFQTLQVLSERSNLSLVKASQEAATQEAQKVQGQFKVLVTKLSELAEKGHAGAKMVMEELLNRNVGPGPQAEPPPKVPTKPETKPLK